MTAGKSAGRSTPTQPSKKPPKTPMPSRFIRGSECRSRVSASQNSHLQPRSGSADCLLESFGCSSSVSGQTSLRYSCGFLCSNWARQLAQRLSRMSVRVRWLELQTARREPAVMLLCRIRKSTACPYVLRDRVRLGANSRLVPLHGFCRSVQELVCPSGIPHGFDVGRIEAKCSI